MNKTLKITITVLLLINIICSVIYFVDLKLFLQLAKEDGLVENLTAITCLIFSLLLLSRYIKVSKAKKAKWKFFNLVMIFALFFVFGEEISWGQRIFSIESNEFFLENNKQQETNLHNLEVLGIGINKLIFGKMLTIIFGIYFLFGYIIYRKNTAIRKIINEFGIPIPKASQTAVLLGITALVMSIADSKKWELWEFTFSVILLWVFVDPFNVEEKLFYTKKDLPVKKRLRIYPPTTIKVS
ncbi:hypothetical protein OO013_02720 [Mangrovivirga sp. M17]|uniref:Uncharacterized protein n=1 Tax=Mangrovivirga halotolerans TaxID=2993936 RepID=A0ABT3RLS6_9BACT|nr:hypothetical protein [Mangrovivirga halotolerans]MCX2742760.1 hypothetical protein [Mangrovivirga halotolerans]